MRRLLSILACLTVVAALPRPASALPAGYRSSTVARLTFPSGLAFNPSGTHLFVNERAGRVRLIRRGTLLAEPFASIDTTTSGEGGLLGVAVHPRFDQDRPFVYVFATSPSGRTDRVIRLRADGARARSRETIFEMPSGSGYHHGGAIAFGPDDKLYVSNGESHERRLAQNPRVLGGKIYRLDDDGSIPRDNPFPGHATWSYGHRNPFGLAFDPETGRLWSSENGPEANDEVNRIVRGGNYGWPVVQGDANRRGYRDPARDYRRIIVPTMMAFSGEAFSASYRGDLFMGVYSDGTVRRLRLDDGRTGIRSESVFADFSQGVVGVAWGPDGLYVTTAGTGRGRVIRITAPSRGTPSPSPSPSPTPTPTPTPTPSPTLPPAEPAGSTSPWPLVTAATIAAGIAATIIALRGRRS